MARYFNSFMIECERKVELMSNLNNLLFISLVLLELHSN